MADSHVDQHNQSQRCSFGGTPSTTASCEMQSGGEANLSDVLAELDQASFRSAQELECRLREVEEAMRKLNMDPPSYCDDISPALSGTPSDFNDTKAHAANYGGLALQEVSRKGAGEQQVRGGAQWPGIDACNPPAADVHRIPLLASSLTPSRHFQHATSAPVSLGPAAPEHRAPSMASASSASPAEHSQRTPSMASLVGPPGRARTQVRFATGSPECDRVEKTEDSGPVAAAIAKVMRSEALVQRLNACSTGTARPKRVETYPSRHIWTPDGFKLFFEGVRDGRQHNLSREEWEVASFSEARSVSDSVFGRFENEMRKNSELERWRRGERDRSATGAGNLNGNVLRPPKPRDDVHCRAADFLNRCHGVQHPFAVEAPQGSSVLASARSGYLGTSVTALGASVTALGASVSTSVQSGYIGRNVAEPVQSGSLGWPSVLDSVRSGPLRRPSASESMRYGFFRHA